MARHALESLNDNPRNGMSAQILPFGGCPGCGGTDGWHADRWHADGYPNDGRDLWFFCDRHKTRWRARSNLFSGWRDENYEAWLRNRFKLARYMWVVEPVMPLR